MKNTLLFCYYLRIKTAHHQVQLKGKTMLYKNIPALVSSQSALALHFASR